MKRLVPATLSLLLALVPARADGEFDRIVTAHDRARLDRYEATRSEALQEALNGGEPAEVEQLNALLGRPKMSFDGFDMTGEWRCRVTKVGGLPPLVVYDWFRCRVTDDGAGWRLTKISGSQRTTGRFFTQDARTLAYLGSSYIGGDPPRPYGTGPETDQVGLAFRTGRSEWRIELPQPVLESKLDIIEFGR